MKRHLLIIAAATAAVAAFSACSKSETVPVSGDSLNEICYMVAPRVKSDDYKEFDKDWHFYSFAYYLPAGQDWATYHMYSSAYLYHSQISWDSTVWRDKYQKYYWPKAGSLTFLAWAFLSQSIPSVNPEDADYGVPSYSANEAVSPTYDVNPSYGISFTDYNIVTDKNLDALVADIKADQTRNTKSGESGNLFREGVPTLFRHVLSKVIFTATTKEDYGTDVVFTINSIKFNNLAIKGTYNQGTWATAPCTGGWIPQEPTDEADKVQTYYSNDTDPFTVPNKSTVYEIHSYDGQYFYIPQTFDENDTFTIDYNVTYKAGHIGPTSDIVQENIKQVCSLKPATGDNIFDEFTIGKKYTINLVFGLDEIVWDPAVQDWEDVSSDEVTIQ